MTTKPDTLDKVRKDIVDSLYIAGGVILIGGVSYIGYEYYVCQTSGKGIEGCIMDKIDNTVKDSYDDGILQYSGIGIAKKFWDAISDMFGGNKDKDKDKEKKPDPHIPDENAYSLACRKRIRAGEHLRYNEVTKTCEDINSSEWAILFDKVITAYTLPEWRKQCIRIGWTIEKELIKGRMWARYAIRDDGETSNQCSIYRYYPNPERSLITINGIAELVDGKRVMEE